jgi:hypothetical protein
MHREAIQDDDNATKQPKSKIDAIINKSRAKLSDSGTGTMNNSGSVVSDFNSSYNSQGSSNRGAAVRRSGKGVRETFAATPSFARFL